MQHYVLVAWQATLHERHGLTHSVCLSPRVLWISYQTPLTVRPV